MTVIFLGYAPFLGESFRIYFQNFSGFISLAALLTLVYWRQFKQFILEKNSIQFWWLSITLYCILITLPHLGKYSLHEIYLDLGVFFVMLFGLFFGKKIATKISLTQLLVAMTLVLILVAGKVLWMWLHQTPALPDGLGFFIGSATYSGLIPKIILRGGNPFLISMLVLVIGVLLLRKNTAFEAIGLSLVFLLAMGALIIAGVRSIYFGIIPSCIFLAFFLPKMDLKKYAYIGILLSIFFTSLYLFVGRDAIAPNVQDSLKAFPSMAILTNQGWWIFNSEVVNKMVSGYIPVLNSMSVTLKMAEYLEVINGISCLALYFQDRFSLLIFLVKTLF